MNGPANALQISNHYLKLKKNHKKLVVVVPTNNDIFNLSRDLSFFLPHQQILELPSWDSLPFELVSPSLALSSQRIKSLDGIVNESEWILIISCDALVQKIVSPEQLLSQSITLNQGDLISRSSLIGNFELLGYQRASRVQSLGDYSVRGEVIDFFPYSTSEAIRLQFFDNEIELIKRFRTDDQRSTQTLKSIKILPLREWINYPLLPDKSQITKAALSLINSRGSNLGVLPYQLQEYQRLFNQGILFPGVENFGVYFGKGYYSLIDFLPKVNEWFVIDPTECILKLEELNELIKERTERFIKERTWFAEPALTYVALNEVSDSLIKYPTKITSLNLDNNEKGSKEKETVIPNIELRSITKSQAGQLGFKSALEFIKKQLKKGNKVAITTLSESRVKQLESILESASLNYQVYNCSYFEWKQKSLVGAISIINGEISEGFQLPEQQITVISEEEIFYTRSQRTKKISIASLRKIKSTLNQLNPNDYVVHLDYGIGQYKGLVHKTLDGVEGDFLEIEYLDSTLLLPVQMIGRIQKYSTPTNETPKLDKLSSNRWITTKAKVQESVSALAGDLIKVYAKRSISKGWRFEPWGAEDERFAETFPYNETEDQLKAIHETVNDMSKDIPMDRLICGDVGFGKTEVAIRAAFKCTQHARQVAILTPTTLLCEQHYQSFKRRFQGYPVEIGIISRFYSAKENKATLDRLKDGTLDIIIGTHRLLTGDVYFKDLGLLIIDEEQRFGVKQKEKLKSIKSQIDILTLTATPIPRTLHMSLIGIRDISVISTPPLKRLPVKTYVTLPKDSIIRDAILRELKRQGQLFYLHNRVQSIDSVTEHLKKVVPEARIKFSHGQQPKEELEEIMKDFIDHKFDVLVSTTIIESGIDLPNANTIIISDSYRYGLAQLYQLRGRVGRGDKQGYAYFLTPNKGELTSEAKERLNVFTNMSDLGLGFELALRDLEIRGSGNLLGKEQSGQVASVGFDLYTRILREAIEHLKGDQTSDLDNPDPEVTLGVVAYIPNSYIPDTSERLILYQRLADIYSEQESIDLTLEIEDRFGPPPREVNDLIKVMEIRSLLRRKGVTKLEKNRFQGVNFTLSPNAPFDPNLILGLPKRGIKVSKNLTISTSDWFTNQEIDLIELKTRLDELISSITRSG